MQKFDLMISIGSRCVSSLGLRRSGLQFESFPFDWLYPVSPLKAIELIENNFENFLQKDAMVFVPDEQYLIFKDQNHDIEFRHDFRTQNLNDWYETVHQRYQRRICRLYERIGQARSILLVSSVDNYTEDKVLNECLERFKKKFPGKKVVLLSAFMNREKSEDRPVEVMPNIFRTMIMKDNDNSRIPYREFFRKNYRLTMRTRLEKFFPNLKYKCKRFLQTYPSFAKFLCCFIPFRAYRHKIRYIYRGNSEVL